MIKKIISAITIVLIMVVSVLIMINKESITQIGIHSYLLLFLVCVISNASVFLPAPGLIVVIAACNVLNWILVSCVAAVGFTVGECVGYYAGFSGRSILECQNIEKKLEIVTAKNIFVFGMIPMPIFDFIGVAAGYKKMDIKIFFVACLMGKLIKTVIVSFCCINVIEIIQK